MNSGLRLAPRFCLATGHQPGPAQVFVVPISNEPNENGIDGDAVLVRAVVDDAFSAIVNLSGDEYELVLTAYASILAL